jgi:hypothetical protein
MAGSFGGTRSADRLRRLSRVSAPNLHSQPKTSNIFLENMVHFRGWRAGVSRPTAPGRCCASPTTRACGYATSRPAWSSPNQRLRHRHRLGRGRLRGETERRLSPEGPILLWTALCGRLRSVLARQPNAAQSSYDSRMARTGNEISLMTAGAVLRSAPALPGLTAPCRRSGRGAFNESSLMVLVPVGAAGEAGKAGALPRPSMGAGGAPASSFGAWALV